jgi:XTP/dITP diphosphohydrolase
LGDVVADTPEQVVSNWEAIKKEEKGRASVTEGIPSSLPALLLSTKLQRKAVSVGLDDPLLDEDAGALAERLTALDRTGQQADRSSPDAVLSDDGDAGHAVGDLLFAVANLSRRVGVDPEQALRARALAFRDSILEREAAPSE